MSVESTIFVHPTSITAPTTLACSRCRRTDQLHVVEIVDVLSPATFSLGLHAHAYTPSAAARIMLADTQRWPSGGATVCCNCDQVGLRNGDLIPLIKLVNRARPGGAAKTVTTPGAQS